MDLKTSSHNLSFRTIHLSLKASDLSVVLISRIIWKIWLYEWLTVVTFCFVTFQNIVFCIGNGPSTLSTTIRSSVTTAATPSGVTDQYSTRYCLTIKARGLCGSWRYIKRCAKTCRSKYTHRSRYFSLQFQFHLVKLVCELLYMLST